jgi:hypothetical protein
MVGADGEVKASGIEAEWLKPQRGFSSRKPARTLLHVQRKPSDSPYHTLELSGITG